jgi:hypothetical protein
VYLEDDMLIPREAIQYWLAEHEALVQQDYNLGFVRIEPKNGVEYITDIPRGNELTSSIELNGRRFWDNSKFPYCAFWIYDKAEFARFVASPYWKLENVPGYGLREKSALGLHGVGMNWYKATLIPSMDGRLAPDCRIYHLPNNYVADTNSHFAKIPFTKATK